jgi:hypothetical protein
MTDHYLDSFTKLMEEIVSLSDITSKWIISSNGEDYMNYLNSVRQDLIKNTIAIMLKEKSDCLKQIIQSNNRLQDLMNIIDKDKYVNSEIELENYKKEMMVDKIQKLDIAIERTRHLEILV